MWDFAEAARRLRVPLFAVLAASALVLVAWIVPTPARASGCTDSWTNAKGGAWQEGANWSKGAAPVEGETVCISTAGTYTVTYYQTTAAPTLKSLTIGGATGTQTLALGSTCSANASLAVTEGVGVEASGVLVMTNGDACANNATLTASVTNAGAIDVEVPHGGARTISGSFTNKGTLNLNVSTSFPGAKALIVNEGTINMAAGAVMSVTGGQTVENTGGTIAGTAGGGFMRISGGESTFSQGAGKETGEPVYLEDAALHYTGSGTGSLHLRGTSSISGNVGAGQLLTLESTCGKNAVVSAAGGFTNSSTINLTNADACANNVTLSVATGTVSNEGTIAVEDPHGGARVIDASITNNGTLSIGGTTTIEKTSAVLTNEGAVTIATGTVLNFNAHETVNSNGGSIAGTGTGYMIMDGGESTFNQGAGKETGEQPVYLEDAALHYVGAGTGSIHLRGNSSFSGNVGAGQLLTLESTCGKNAVITAAPFTNTSTIHMTNADSCANNVSLSLTEGAILNEGTIDVEQPHGGLRAIDGSLTNKGTLNLDSPTSFEASKSVVTNEGSLNIGAGDIVSFGKQNTLNSSSGTIAAGAGGYVIMSGGGTTFNQGAGSQTGELPLYIEDGVLHYAGAGTGAIHLRGSSTFTGNVGTGQSLTLESTCGKNALISTPAGFTNKSTIVLTNADNCGNNVTLVVEGAGTLLNEGTIDIELPHGGVRAINGDLTNKGTFAANGTTRFEAAKTTIVNEGTMTIATGAQLQFRWQNTLASNAGTIAGTGTGSILMAGGGTVFNQNAGKETGEPAIIEDGAVNLKAGSGAFLMRGSTTLAGEIAKTDKLTVQSTCGKNAVMGTATFKNSGTLILTNGDNCGNNAIVSLAGGTLENKGTLTVEVPHGGARTIEGALKNEKTVSLLNQAHLAVSGAYTQTAKGTLQDSVAGFGSNGVLAASGSASIAGTLSLLQAKAFKAAEGQSYQVLTASALTGTLSKITGDTVSKAPGLYYRPTYAASSLTLVVTLAKVAVVPGEGLPGSNVKVKVSGFVANDKVKLTFTDAKGVKTTYATLTANAAGEAEAEVAIPAAAAVGSGKFTTTSTIAGVTVTAIYKVT